jgi:hypothetical protein
VDLFRNKFSSSQILHDLVFRRSSSVHVLDELRDNQKPLYGALSMSRLYFRHLLGT